MVFLLIQSRSWSSTAPPPWPLSTWKWWDTGSPGSGGRQLYTRARGLGSEHRLDCSLDSPGCLGAAVVQMRLALTKTHGGARSPVQLCRELGVTGKGFALCGGALVDGSVLFLWKWVCYSRSSVPFLSSPQAHFPCTFQHEVFSRDWTEAGHMLLALRNHEPRWTSFLYKTPSLWYSVTATENGSRWVHNCTLKPWRAHLMSSKVLHNLLLLFLSPTSLCTFHLTPLQSPL